MPELSLAVLDLDALSPPELEQRRREIILTLRSKYPDYDAVVRLGDEGEVILLQQLAAITSTLRRRSSGPPREARKPRIRAPIGLDDI
jgi:hypothetical protein